MTENEISALLFKHLMNACGTISTKIKPLLENKVNASIIDVKLPFDIFFPLFSSMGVWINMPNVKILNKKIVMDNVLSQYSNYLMHLNNRKIYDTNLFVKDSNEILIFKRRLPVTAKQHSSLDMTDLWSMFDTVFDFRYNLFAKSILSDLSRMKNPGFLPNLPNAVFTSITGSQDYVDAFDFSMLFWSSMNWYEETLQNILLSDSTNSVGQSEVPATPNHSSPAMIKSSDSVHAKSAGARANNAGAKTFPSRIMHLLLNIYLWVSSFLISIFMFFYYSNESSKTAQNPTHFLAFAAVILYYGTKLELKAYLKEHLFFKIGFVESLKISFSIWGVASILTGILYFLVPDNPDAYFSASKGERTSILFFVSLVTGTMMSLIIAAIVPRNITGKTKPVTKRWIFIFVIIVIAIVAITLGSIYLTMKH